jgi:hypothetical protein
VYDYLGPVENASVEIEEDRPMADDLTWIRVQDRLPDFGEKVMVTRDTGGPRRLVESASRKCVDSRGEVWDSGDRNSELTDVIAWALVPNASRTVAP